MRGVINRTWWHIPVVSATEGLGQEDCLNPRV